MISTRENHCRTCRHFLGGQTCKAFTNAIPNELWSGKNLHYEAYINDGGFRYERAVDEFPPLPWRFFDEEKR